MTIILRIKFTDVPYKESIMNYVEKNLVLKVNHQEVIISGECSIHDHKQRFWYMTSRRTKSNDCEELEKEDMIQFTLRAK